MTSQRTINMIAAALGGEGGGVFTDWIIQVAERENWLCQTTSLAGVAQRTGATIYYLELYPRSEMTDVAPVMSLFPAQGDIDIAIASEIAEAGRMVQRGFVTRDRTTLIASDHRVFGITEKIQLGDGTIDPEAVRSVAQDYARDYIHYDMLALANQHGAVISAVMLGGLAGAGVLPFAKASFEEVIRAGGKAVQTNLAAFEASYQQARSRGVETFTPAEPVTQAGSEPVPVQFQLPAASNYRGQQLLDRLHKQFPESCHELIYQALVKLVDYQDWDYAATYLDELLQVLALDSGEQAHQLTRETARYLALWMCFEDIPRVAQFKTRALRMDKIRSEVKADADQLIDVTEFFRPRPEELCALLPPPLARSILGSRLCRKILNVFSGGKKLRTNTIVVFLLLRGLAGLRRWRRHGLGYQHEHSMIQRWLTSLKGAANTDPALAQELAACGRLVKGYGDTRARTTAQMCAILARCEQGNDVDAAGVSAWREAALHDDDGIAFMAALAAVPQKAA